MRLAGRGVLVALTLLGVGCRARSSTDRDRIADSIVAAEQAAAPAAAPAVPWQRFEGVPHLRLDGATAVVGDTVYLLGGVGPGDTLSAIRTVDRFDQVSRRWSLGPGLPSAVSHFQAAVVGDTAIWIAGGFLSRHGGPPTAEVWRLDRRVGQWLAAPSLPDSRGGGALVAIGDTLYYAGGWGEDRVTDRGELWQLVPRATAWRARAAMPVARGDAAAVSRGGRLMVFGGQQSHDFTPVDLDDAWAYDPRADRWTELAPMPATRSHMAPATVQWGDWVLFPGGGDIGAGRRFTNDLLGYDVRRNVWRRLPELPTRLRGANAWMRGDTLQVAGGAVVNNAPSNRHLWARSLRGAWMLLPGEGPSVPEPRVAVVGGAMVVFGDKRRSTWQYGLPRGRWGAEDDLPYRPRQGEILGVASDERRLQLLGGTPLGDSTTLLQSLDPVARRWSPGVPVPNALRRPVLVIGAGSTWLIDDPEWRRSGADRSIAPGVVYRLDRAGRWDSVSVVPMPRFRSLVAADDRELCVLGGAGPQSSWEQGVQCMQFATLTWRSSDAGHFGIMPGYLGSPGSAAAVNGRFFIFGWAGFAFDPTRNVWDSVPRPPVEAGDGVVVADGDRLLRYSSKGGRVWMLWP